MRAKQIIEHKTVPIQTTFRPAWWLRNAHLQTIYTTFCRSLPLPPQSRRERLATADNDFIDIDWCGEGDTPLVVLLHGLTGNSRSHYILGLQHALLGQGVRSVALNFRGCSGEANNLARSYHSGDTTDLDFLYRTLRQREPETKLAFVGFSLGGNVLLKWLGEQGEQISPVAAVAVSVPLVLAQCATRLDRGLSRLYRHRLIHELKRYIQGKQHHLERIGNHHEAETLHRLGDLSAIKSFWQYDEQVVARLHGFESAKHYYSLSSSRQYLDKIAVPTLLIQALDDPFMTRDVIPEQNELSPSVSLELTSSGGHVGFIHGNIPFKPRYWLEQRIPEFLQQHGIL